MKVLRESGLFSVYWKHITVSFTRPTCLVELAAFGLHLSHQVYEGSWLNEGPKHFWNGYIDITAFGFGFGAEVTNNSNY